MTSVRVPGFLPSTSGFHFANAFPHIPVRQFELAGIATLSIGDAANGLCGGMSYAVADLFLAGVMPPADTSPPAGGSAAFEYIVDRQIDSFDEGHVPLRFYELMAPSRPDREPAWADIVGHFGIEAHSLTWVMVEEEWPRIRADLDAGSLSALGLVRARSADPLLLGRNHQVIAYGYDLEATALTLWICDPNWPADDGVSLSLDIGDPHGEATTTYSKPDLPTLCFFRTPYAGREPVPWRTPAGSPVGGTT